MSLGTCGDYTALAEGRPMFPKRNGGPLFRPVAHALVCCWLLAGCSHHLAQHSVDLLSALPSDTDAPETSQPLPERTPSKAAIPPGNSTERDAPPRRSPPEELLPPPAIGAAGQPSASESLPPLPLPDAIQFALRNNPRLRAAQAAVANARGQEAVAFAPFLPQVDWLNRYVATGKATLPGAPGPTGVVNVTGVGEYSVWQSELQLQWMLYDFGRTEGRHGQAVVREEIARLQVVRAQETVAYDVATAYLQALEAAALRDIAEETIRQAEAVLKDVQVRREGGIALRDDVLRGQVQLSESRDSLVRAQDDEVTALAQLNNALGRNASWPLRPAGVLEQGRFSVSLAECLQRAAAQRPEIGVARDRVAIAQFGRLAAEGEFLPELKMLGSIGRIEGENVVGGWQEGASIQFNVPLFHGGAKRGNLVSAAADTRQAVADAQSMLNDISLEVTVAHRGVISAQERQELSRPAVEQSAEALRIVRGQYRSGTAMPTDVISAETASTRAEQRYATARIDYLSALARLAYVMGDSPGELCAPLTEPIEEQ